MPLARAGTQDGGAHSHAGPHPPVATVDPPGQGRRAPRTHRWTAEGGTRLLRGHHHEPTLLPLTLVCHAVAPRV